MQNESLTLAWDAPTSNGGLPLTSYIIERQGPGPGWTEVARVDPVANSIRINNLKKEEEYNFRVSAENKAGRGDAVKTAYSIKMQKYADVPGAPRELTMYDRQNAIILEWKTPSDGGSPIFNYVIERSTNSGRFTPIGRVSAYDTYFKDVNNQEGLYEYRVYAENECGIGQYSSLGPIRIIGEEKPPRPTKPEIVSFTNNSITLQWNTPKTKKPINNFKIQAKSNYGWSVVAEKVWGSPFTVSDLLEGVKYQFKIAAVTKQGEGEFSEPSDSIVLRESIKEVAPVISGVSDIYVKKGDDAKIECNIGGVPLPTVNW